jgi:hypothetical protein
MKSPLWRALALIAMSILIPLLMLEDAQAARRSGLAGNLQITDPDDVFIFPHHNIRYRDRMTIDMGGESSFYSPPDGGGVDNAAGSAHLIFGSESWAFNLAASRSDFLTGVASGFWGGNDRGIFGPQMFVDPTGPSDLDPFSMNWVDVGFARALASSEIGFRVGVGRAADKSTSTPAAGTEFENDEFARIVHVQASWGNDTVDLAGEFAFGTSGFSQTGNADPADDFDLEGGYTEFAFGLRKYWEWAGYEWTVLGNFARQSSDEDVFTGTGTTASDEQTVTMWAVGFGPCWRNAPETWQVAAHIWVGSQNGEDNPNGDDNDETFRALTLPGFTGSMEYVHGRWAVRGGARSYFDFERGEEEGDPTFEDFTRSYSFAWTAGASVALGDNFLVDVAINEIKILDGPAFLGAQSGAPAFVIVSATLNWGGSGE